MTALLIVAAAALCCADVAGAWRMLRRDGARTASPNAGWPMAALAGALGVRLEKAGHYVLNVQGVEPDAITHLGDVCRHGVEIRSRDVRSSP